MEQQYSKNRDKNKYVYSGYKIADDEESEWSFDNDYARNVIIFGVHNSSSSHTNNLQNNFLILGEGDTLILILVLLYQKKSLVLILVKKTQHFAWAYIIMLTKVICLLMEEKYLNLKPTIKMLTFQLDFV